MLHTTTLGILLACILVLLPLLFIIAWQRGKLWFARRYCLAYYDMEAAQVGLGAPSA